MRATGKLAIKLGDAALAGKLVEAGYTTPRQIKAATDADLQAIPGIGPASVRAIRARFPRI